MLRFATLLIVCAIATPTSAKLLLGSGSLQQSQRAYEELYAAGSRDGEVLLGMARFSLWRDHIDDAEIYAREVPDGPDKAAAQAVLRTVKIRRGDAAANRYIIEKPGTVVVPFLAKEPLPTIRLGVNGREGTFYLDTGGPNLILDDRFAKSVGIAPEGNAVGTFGGGKTGAVEDGIADRVVAGNLVVRSVPISVIPGFHSAGIDGVLGTRFLRRFRSTIDYLGSRLILEPRENPPHVFSPSAVEVPFWFIGDHFIYARGAIGSGPEAMWLVDSGLSGGGIAVWDVKTLDDARVSVDRDHELNGSGGGGAFTSFGFVAPTARLGGASARSIGGILMKGSPIGAGPAFAVAGILSHTLLEHWSVTIDFDRMTLVLDSVSPRVDRG